MNQNRGILIPEKKKTYTMKIMLISSIFYNLISQYWIITHYFKKKKIERLNMSINSLNSHKNAYFLYKKENTKDKKLH